MFNDSDNGQTQYCEECQKWVEKCEKLEKENKGLQKELYQIKEDIKLSPLCYQCKEENCIKQERDKYKDMLKEINEIAKNTLYNDRIIFIENMQLIETLSEVD